MNILLADPQDITRAGLLWLCAQMGDTIEGECITVTDKPSLVQNLKQNPESLVVLDYTLFDINDVDELSIICQCYPESQWLIFSDDLSIDFIKQAAAISHRISILFKDSPMSEIRQCLTTILSGNRYVCQRVMELLLAPRTAEQSPGTADLTPTEREILHDIALGMTTREIAEKRYSSFHTVNTHRKNIFRKINVNNVHEATRYALRAGLIDSAEYYI
ncbi:MAG: response regulator transcription factor [Prevotella sp.]|jgi:DNA-binding NarL/FixJ family response regulator|nr:response regulator transcription factor [Prevotella sp.]